MAFRIRGDPHRQLVKLLKETAQIAIFRHDDPMASSHLSFELYSYRVGSLLQCLSEHYIP